MTPKVFAVATAEQDWAGEGRIVKAHTKADDIYARHQMTVELDNGWHFSCIWGFGAYSTYAHPPGGSLVPAPPSVSPDAEILPSPPHRGDLFPGGVEGWVTPAKLQRALIAAERGDEQGVLSALTARESEEA